MAQSKAAERFAESLLQLATEHGQQAAVFGDMERLAAMLKATPELGRVLKSPIVSSPKKLSILNALFPTGASELSLRFFEQVSRRNREPILVDMAGDYVKKYLHTQGKTTGEVISATALGPEEKNEIAALAKKLTGMDVLLEERVDAKLIGGFILRVGGKQIDQSVAAKLDQMRLQLTSQ